MKRLSRLILAALVTLFLTPAIHAAQTVIEAPIGYVGGAYAIQPSTTSTTTTRCTDWTRITVATSTLPVATHQSAPNQSGLVLNNLSTNNASFLCTMATGTPGFPPTVGEIEIKKGDNPFRPLADDIYLYCVSKHTSPEILMVNPVRQKP